MHVKNFISVLTFFVLFMTVGSRSEAQIATLSFDGKAALAGEIVMVPDSHRLADAKMMMSGQDRFLLGETVLIVTAGELMSVTENAIRFPALEGLDVGEVSIEFGPETVFCNADGTLSKDWLTVGQNAVAAVPQGGGPAISIRNALWMFEDLMMIPTAIDPSCSNTDYPLMPEE